MSNVVFFFLFEVVTLTSSERPSFQNRIVRSQNPRSAFDPSCVSISSIGNFEA